MNKKQFLLLHIKKYKYEFILPVCCMILLAIITPFAYYLSKLVIDEVLKLHVVKPYEINTAFLNFKNEYLFQYEYYKELPKIIFNFIFEPYYGEKWHKIFSFIIIPVFLLKSILTYVRTWRIQKIGHQIITDFQKNLYNHFLKLPLSYFNKTKTGEISSRIISDIYRIQEVVTDVILQGLQQSLMICGTLVFLIAISPMLTVISFIGVPIAMAPIIITSKYLKKKSKKAQQEIGSINSLIYETITNMSIIKIFNKENYEGNRFAEAIKKLLNTLIKASKMGSLSSPLVEFLSTFIVVSFVWLGCHFIETGVFKAGDFIAFIVLVYSLYEPIKRLGRMNEKISNGMAALDRIIEVMEIPTENYQESNQKALTLNKEIRFENITFKYDESQVLKNVSFAAPVGKTTAIVGLSGSGKTTLVNLLPAFYQIQEGSIYFDQQNLKDYSLASIRSTMSLVSQDILLFNESVLYNIAYGTSDSSNEEVLNAAKKAHADEFIQKLPSKYDTIIGERGTKLSGGQKQRLSIARAILANTPILILDEATSALDVQSETIIQKALEELMTGKTTFVIAHRLSTIINADQIIVLDQGEINAIGTHEELMSSSDLYHSLYTTFTKQK